MSLWRVITARSAPESCRATVAIVITPVLLMLIIYIHPFAPRKIEGDSYLFRSRGETEIKGKGRMHTYFLLGRDDRPMTEPDDDFTNELNYPTIKISNSGKDAVSEEVHCSFTTQSVTLKIPDRTSDKPIPSRTCIVL